MKEILKNKFFLFVFLLFIFIFFNNCNVFAKSISDFTNDDIDVIVRRGYTVIDENGYNSKDFTKYYINFAFNKIGVCYFTDDSSLDCINWSSRKLLKAKNNCAVAFNPDNLEFIEFNNNMENQIGNPWDVSYVDTIYFSTFDIKQGNDIIFNKNISFFRVPPQSLEEIVVQVEEMSVAVILPTIMMVIILVVGLVISLIGLKRGFQTLVSGLKT